MQQEIFVKYFTQNNALKELEAIGFDEQYKNIAVNKYLTKAIKIFNLKSPEANILKQLCLSLGFDAAVAHGTINCSIDYTSCIITPTKAQLKDLINKLNLQPYRLKRLAEELLDLSDEEKQPLKIRNRVFDWTKPYIVGILNITPDSFSDGGEYNTTEKAINRVEELIKDGADIIDLGAESTRPNFENISEETELEHLCPLIEAVRKINKEIILSVDTRKSTVAKQTLELGTDIINDVSGLTFDKNMKELLKEKQVPFIFVCSKEFQNGDIIENVYRYFNDSLKELTLNGIERKNIILDVGIGFNKTIQDNFELIKRSNEFSSLNQPMFWGISRKSFMQKTFELSPKDCDNCTVLYDSILAQNGANLLRVHNVKKHFEMLKYLSKFN